MTDRWVALDVGETLVDETRVWSLWADEFEIPRLTFFTVLGAVIAGGGQHGGVFEAFGIEEAGWRDRLPAVEQRYGGFKTDDLYPDALRSAAALRVAGYRLAIVANQPAQRTAELRALGFEADVIAMSGELGVHKPDPAFYARSLALLGDPPASEVAYVGDRVDNDVIPAANAGMRAIWIRRGPWGRIQQLPAGADPALVVDTLDELVARVAGAWLPAS